MDDPYRTDGTRLEEQTALLTRQHCDLLVLQECKWDKFGSRRLNDLAAALGVTGRVLVPSQRYGCDLAMLVRETDRLRVLEERHDRSSGAFWHTLAVLRIHVGGECVDPVRVCRPPRG
ncbi:hypothetical protein [Actinomadura macrotermitis]|uniref:hypothetical protein n=1 Tax=Actinomadura macrotermitis TaxID=2585200 RepID=UPI001295D93A|nr:hypothetical protein [Actinomadura macrotermitis]